MPILVTMHECNRHTLAWRSRLSIVSCRTSIRAIQGFRVPPRLSTSFCISLVYGVYKFWVLITVTFVVSIDAGLLHLHV